MNDESENNELKDAKIVRLVVTKEADMVVNEITTTVNSGFEAGRATKLDVASFIILWFKEHVSDEIILNIRMQLVNDLTMLDSLIKKAKTSGNLPLELKEAMAQYFFGNGLNSAKKTKKNLKPDGITDRHRDGDAA